MTALPEGLTQREVDRYAKLDAGIKKLQPEHKTLGEKIKKLVVGKGTSLFGNVVVKRNEADSFDKTAAAHDFPYEKFPHLYATVFDASKLDAKTKAKYTSKVQRVSVEVLND